MGEEKQVIGYSMDRVKALESEILRLQNRLIVHGVCPDCFNNYLHSDENGKRWCDVCKKHLVAKC